MPASPVLRSSPRCPYCRADLVEVTTYQWVAATPADGDGGTIPVLVVSCGRCSSAIGIQPPANDRGPEGSRAGGLTARAHPDDPTAVVAAAVPLDVRVDLRYHASRLEGEVAGIPVDVLVTGTPGGSSATGTIGPDRIDAEWRIDLGGRGAASRAHLVLRSAGTELVLDGPPLDGPVPDGPVRLEGAAGAVEVAWSDRAGGATLAVEGAVAGLDVELHIVWSAEHGGGVVWGSVGDEAMAIDARPSGAAVAVTGRYGGPPVWVLPAIGALLLPERLSG